jgi:hypothetical protein
VNTRSPERRKRRNGRRLKSTSNTIPLKPDEDVVGNLIIVVVVVAGKSRIKEERRPPLMIDLRGMRSTEKRHGVIMKTSIWLVQEGIYRRWNDEHKV